jgi:hypothetical protein
MKVVITESRLEKVITDYLDDFYYPNYGWKGNSRSDIGYQDEVDKWGDIVFFVDDQESYIYYGCNANAGPEDEFFAGYGHLHNYECPLLSIYPYMAKKLDSTFGDIWKPIFKKWFEDNTGLEVAQFTTDYI